ncbi:MAG: hypothetical protein ACKO04_09995 [Actinomycetes bacterium]
MAIDLDQLITVTKPDDLSDCSLADLRVIRDGYQEVENGLSYARRIVQGRLDTVAVELDRRGDGGEADLMARLPEALAANTRSAGVPRPVRDLEPPAWADSLTAPLDAAISPSQLGNLAELSDADLATAAGKIGEIERELSEARREIHRRIDRVQDELVGRYRSGATVDDLLA